MPGLGVREIGDVGDRVQSFSYKIKRVWGSNENTVTVVITLCCITAAAATAAKSLQSCPTLCDPTDSTQQAPLSLGFSRQEYYRVAVSFSNA